MKLDEIRTKYKRILPHIQPVGAAFFVTFRLKDSIPTVKLWELKQDYENKIAELMRHGLVTDAVIYEEKKRAFAKYDELLDRVIAGPTHLRNNEIAKLVADELHRHDGQLYDLIAYTVLANHVHLLIDTSIQVPAGLSADVLGNLNFEPLENIMKKIKGPTAVCANRLLGRNGKFWQKESYDHYVRNPKEFKNTINYILNNPVKARLAEHWEAHPFTYFKA